MHCPCQKRNPGSTPRDPATAAALRAAEGDSFPRMNWVMVLLLQFLMGTIYSALIPSMHQLVVSPTKAFASSINDQQRANTTLKETDKFWPGLGLSELFYSWTVCVYSIGEILGASVAGYVTKYIPYRYTILLAALTLAVGLLLYALTVQGWMIIVARLLLGVHTGFDLVIVTAYLGETAIEVTAKREAAGGKRDHSGATLKDRLFIWFSFVTNGSYLCGLVACSIMAQFPQVDPYRWSAWFVLIITIAYIIIFLLVFKENKKFRLPKCVGSSSKAEKREKCTSSRTRTSQWRHRCKEFMLYTFLVICGFIAGALFTVMDTLLNPVLSDHFGFTIADSSYFILGITCVLVSTAGILYILKKLHVNNRKVFMFSLCCAIVGGFVMSDWQSIGSDPCALTDSKVQQTFTNSTALQLREACEALSTLEDQCHWNQASLFTGQFCETCRPVCRSLHKTLNFFQFFIGIVLMTISIPLSTASSTIIASDFVSLEMQGTIMGLMFTAQGLGRVVYPLWVDATYEASGKHTYLPMTINSGTLVLVLVVFVVLYKHLAPRNHSAAVKELDASSGYPCDEHQLRCSIAEV